MSNFRVGLIYPIGGQLTSLIRKTKAAGHARSELQLPYTYTYGTSYYGHFETSAEHKKCFDNWMASRPRVFKREWFDMYPVEDRLVAGADRSAGAVFLIDVAGGQGHSVLSLNTRFPGLPGRLIVQDLPRAFENYVPFENVEVQPHDIFTKQPVEGTLAEDYIEPKPHTLNQIY